MSNCSFKVQQVGPMVSFQDAGRPGYLRFGVPSSGPMDCISHAASNLALGKQPGATAIEISLGGLSLECLSGATTIAVVGGSFQLESDSGKYITGTAVTVTAGETLTVRPGKWGSWCYLAFAGQVMADTWLGNTATHAQSGFGGGFIKAGQTITVANAAVLEEREGQIAPFQSNAHSDNVRLVLGPQDHHFSAASVDALLNSEYSLTSAVDRMGARLDGPALALENALSIPSEPILKGAIQVAGDGVPTVLLADHQTTGGYPKIATVISTDLEDFVQRRPGSKIRFSAVSAEDALMLTRSRAAELASYYQDVAKSRGSLAQRLMNNNLISGFMTGIDE